MIIIKLKQMHVFGNISKDRGENDMRGIQWPKLWKKHEDKKILVKICIFVELLSFCTLSCTFLVM